MRIQADRFVPSVTEAFAGVGDLSLFSPPDFDSQATDALVIRSNTQVNAQSLGDLRPSLIATATSGIDHLDQDFLRQQQIPWASAKGCNALAVAQWVVAALAQLDGGLGALKGQCLGIVGFGEVGTRLAKLAQVLGMEVLASDPPREKLGDLGPWAPLDRLLSQAQVISLHVPYIKDGLHPTGNLLGLDQLALIKPGSVLINASRGEVIDPQPLKAQASKLAALILDVWPGEPAVDPELLALTRFASPHVAGYSAQAKLRGTDMVHQAVTQHFDRPTGWPKPDLGQQIIQNPAGLPQLFAQISGLPADDRELRGGGSLKQLRNHYQLRHEWESVQIEGQGALKANHLELLTGLGFCLR